MGPLAPNASAAGAANTSAVGGPRRTKQPGPGASRRTQEPVPFAPISEVIVAFLHLEPQPGFPIFPRPTIHSNLAVRRRWRRWRAPGRTREEPRGALLPHRSARARTSCTLYSRSQPNKRRHDASGRWDRCIVVGSHRKLSTCTRHSQKSSRGGAQQRPVPAVALWHWAARRWGDELGPRGRIRQRLLRNRTGSAEWHMALRRLHISK